MEEQNNINSELPLLTFNSLYNLLREEKRTKTLQQLPDLFYEAVQKYLEDKRNQIKNIGNDNFDKKKKEMHVLKKSQDINLELLNLRTNKISNIVIKNTLFGETSMSTENILPQEMDLCEYFKKGIKNLQREIK